MRCFVAVNLPREVKEKIWRVIKNLQGKGLKKVAPENLHLTLKFLGEVDQEIVKKVKEKLKQVEFNKFSISLKGISYFPNRNFIKVVWLGIEKGRKNLIGLQKEIDKKLEELSFKKEKNKFEPHLTIARVKFLENKRKFVEELEKIKFEKEFEIKSFELMESILQREGPIYKKIESFELR